MPSVLVNVDGDRHLVEPIPYWHAPRADPVLVTLRVTIRPRTPRATGILLPGHPDASQRPGDSGPGHRSTGVRAVPGRSANTFLAARWTRGAAPWWNFLTTALLVAKVLKN